MAKKSANGAATEASSKMASIRAIYEKNPKLLKTRSNDEVVRLWLEQNPGYTEMPQDMRGTMANVKSLMRRKLRLGKRRRKARAAANDASAPPASSVKAKAPKLETLEISIDDCMSLAKNIDREGLDEVIRVLRRARNEVVWKMGS